MVGGIGVEWGARRQTDIRQRARKELDTSPTYGQGSAGLEQEAPWSAARQGRGREQTLHFQEDGARSPLPPPC